MRTLIYQENLTAVILRNQSERAVIYITAYFILFLWLGETADRERVTTFCKILFACISIFESMGEELVIINYLSFN